MWNRCFHESSNQEGEGYNETATAIQAQRRSSMSWLHTNLRDPELNIEQVHFFPLGGIKKTADWVSEVQNPES